MQVGDPFTEKRLMEACLELMATGAVISIQDMGAAGLTCSAVEMGDKGDLGIRLDLDRVPVREAGMTAYEMMLSESQERMLMVLRPEKEAAARAVFEKWDLDFAVVGETIPEDRFVVRLGGEVKADLPLKALSGAAPEYDRPWVADPRPRAARAGARRSTRPRRCCGSSAAPTTAAAAWVWAQYDHQVMADTVVPPGSDAGVVRVHGTGKAIAFTSDVTPRYCRANPERGGMQAVAEAWRNLTRHRRAAAGGDRQPQLRQPGAAGDHGPVRRLHRGIAAACAALDMPIVSGNVSLYNETDGRAILPTPTIGAVGLLASLDELIRMAPARRRRAGAARRDPRAPRPVGAARRALRPRGRRRAAGRSRRRAGGGRVRAGGEGRGAGRGGARSRPTAGSRSRRPRWRWPAASGVAVFADDASAPPAWFFGEDQGRYLVACPPRTWIACSRGRSRRRCRSRVAGAVGGEALRSAPPRSASQTLREAHESALPRLLD